MMLRSLPLATAAPCCKQPALAFTRPSLRAAKRTGGTSRSQVSCSAVSRRELVGGTSFLVGLAAFGPQISFAASDKGSAQGVAAVKEPREAWQVLSDPSSPYVYVDVRSKEEFVQGHPPKAINIEYMYRDPSSGSLKPNPKFLDEVHEAFPEKDAALIVGCTKGTRSTPAVNVLAKDGYSNILHQSKGWLGWQAAGLPRGGQFLSVLPLEVEEGKAEVGVL